MEFYINNKTPCFPALPDSPLNVRFANPLPRAGAASLPSLPFPNTLPCVRVLCQISKRPFGRMGFFTPAAIKGDSINISVFFKPCQAVAPQKSKKSTMLYILPLFP